MAFRSYTLRFGRYWHEDDIDCLPASSGIYCVYACTYNYNADLHRRLISVSKLLYIGESGNIRKRVKEHEGWDEWRSELQHGQNLCFNAAHIAAAWERAEAAMIYALEPPCNIEYMDHFPFDRTRIQIEGYNHLLSDGFIVN